MYIFLKGEQLVYVDDAEVSKYGRSWYHLTADNLEELHAFAARIGLSARSFHRGARHPHYDVTAIRRLDALHSGARPVTAREVVRIARQILVHASSVVAPRGDCQLNLFA